MVKFLYPETAKILQFPDPEIVEMVKKNSGSRNRRNGAISGSGNRRKGGQVLYLLFCNLKLLGSKFSNFGGGSQPILSVQIICFHTPLGVGVLDFRTMSKL